MPRSHHQAAVAVLPSAVYSCNKTHQAFLILGNPQAFKRLERLHTIPASTDTLPASPLPASRDPPAFIRTESLDTFSGPAWQVEDALAAQCTAEAIAAACQRELTQVSSSLAAQLEAESMWQGRAQGLQQQLDQAMQGQQQLQQGLAAAEASVSDHQHSSRCACLGLITLSLPPCHSYHVVITLALSPCVPIIHSS